MFGISMKHDITLNTRVANEEFTPSRTTSPDGRITVKQASHFGELTMGTDIVRSAQVDRKGCRRLAVIFSPRDDVRSVSNGAGHLGHTLVCTCTFGESSDCQTTSG